MKDSFSDDTPDHRILAVTEYISEKMKGQKVILVTKDMNLRMKARSLGLHIAGTMFTLTSCDDFLDVQPASGFTPEYIFSSESEMKALMTRIYSSMTEDGLYGSNLASGLNTNTDVEMSSFKNNTVSTNGSDIGCFDS